MINYYDLQKTVQSYLDANKIFVEENELLLQLSSHPDSPSLYAITETLKFLEVDSIAAKINKNQLDELPDTFLAFVEDDTYQGIKHVEKKSGRLKLKSSGEKTLSIDKTAFLERWNGVVLLAEAPQITKHTSKVNFKTIGVVCFFLFVVINLYSNIPLLFISILSFFGLYFSYLIRLKEIGEHDSIGDKFCGKSEKLNCLKVISSTYKLGKFSFNDVLFSFFLTIVLIALLDNKLTLSSYFFSHFLATLGVIASIYMQWRIIKSWCVLCLMSSAVIVSQTLIISGFLLQDNPTYLSFSVMFIVNFFMLFLGGLLLINFFRAQENYLKRLLLNKNQYLRFKKSSQVIQSFWITSTVLARYPSDMLDLVFGDPKSNNEALVVLSTTCNHCTDTFQEFYKAYHMFKNRYVKFVLRFHINLENSTDDHRMLAIQIVSIYNNLGPEKCLSAVHDWYANWDIKRWLKTWGVPNEQAIEKYSIVLEKQSKWCRANTLYFTPQRILNNRILPEYYELKEIQRFIEELPKDPVTVKAALEFS